MLKRIAIFLTLNIAVILTISLILQIFQIQPYLNAHGLNLEALLIFCLIWGMVGAFISLALSRITAKWMLGVSVIEPTTKDPHLKDLLETVDTLCKRAGLETPEVGIYRSHEVNAFATGPTKKRSLVAVSSGLLNRMNKEELTGVLAHEVTHIANGDMVTMTLLQGVINAFVMFLARVLAYVISGFGKNRENNNSSAMSYYLLTWVFEAVFMSLGFLVIAAFSRYREFRADAGGAKLSSKTAMIAALENLKHYQTAQDTEASPSVAALKISHPSKGGFRSLFATHPPLEERIARLQREA